MSKQDRQPLLLRKLDAIVWRRCGRRVWLDAAADELAGRQVYRYASLGEALLWLQHARTALARPATWPDRYERHVAERLWQQPRCMLPDVYLKCFSFEFSSEALWRTYAGHGGVLRLGIRLRDLVAELNRVSLPRGARVMVGRCRYLDERDLQRALARLQAALADGAPATELGMQALLLKRAGFAWENELRIAVLLPPERQPRAVLEVEGLRVDRLQSVQIDPYLPAWQASAWLPVLAASGLPAGRVGQSGFDAEPAVARGG
jgi:hypothetical protein